MWTDTVFCFSLTQLFLFFLHEDLLDRIQSPPVSRSINMDDEWEEEEQLVVVEVSGIINNDFLSKCRGTCKILDIDSERPMMQIGQYVFAGEYEEALGTCVLFEEAPSKGIANSGPNLKYMGHTAKKLTMQRIFLTEKREDETSSGNCDGGGEESETTCQSTQEGNDNQQGAAEEHMDDTNSKDLAEG
ncbi:general transcription factor 3C polypeptide 6 isoform X2 [Acanthochromis polyacanthus]|uniref:General transcription factor IIIC subunit 6 n=1 Tax=Acanthochromis polyacanthus TaxID=80966 RepID=A0A3Q1F465_9TELE|nr:general transcription factor 3C polypeptide 6 isoform X2 [Acanthochromis polyacanthus]